MQDFENSVFDTIKIFLSSIASNYRNQQNLAMLETRTTLYIDTTPCTVNLAVGNFGSKVNVKIINVLSSLLNSNTKTKNLYSVIVIYSIFSQMTDIFYLACVSSSMFILSWQLSFRFNV